MQLEIIWFIAHIKLCRDDVDCLGRGIDAPLDKDSFENESTTIQ